ncbi:MAG: KamA family radical SAM protein [Kiritimatiellia bacterium]
MVLPFNCATAGWADWQWQLAHTYDAVMLGVQDVPAFPLRVTPYYAALADWENPQDPILQQFLPDLQELRPDAYGPDPFGEKTGAAIAPGIKQRFPDRLLAMMSICCSTYCRHCTRRGLLETANEAQLLPLLDAVRSHPAVREVLLSGGDPLLHSDAELLTWVDALATLPQLDAIRLCTRTPVVLPMRWTEALVTGLAKSRRVWIQTQFNHPRELTAEAIATLDLLVDHGFPVSNQSVLLRGINDDPVVMTELCAKLQRHRVRPYYIFQCDPIAGIEHFRTAPEVAPRLRDYLLNHLGGLACPRVVADLPTASHKTDI